MRPKSLMPCGKSFMFCSIAKKIFDKDMKKIFEISFYCRKIVLNLRCTIPTKPSDDSKMADISSNSLSLSLVQLLFLPLLNLALVFFGVFVVIDADEKHFAVVVVEGVEIFLALDLLQSV